MASSAIASIKFTGFRKGEMFVTFTDGREIVYYDVPREAYEDFAAAKSLGQHFNAYVRDQYEVG